MEADDIFWEKIKESRGHYFVEYLPPRASTPFAALSLVFPNDLERTAVADAMEAELRYWLGRFPVPLMVSSFDGKENVIHLDGVRPCDHLIGFVKESDQGIVSSWRLMTEDELPKKQVERAYLERVYADLTFKTGEQISRDADRDRHFHRIGWFMLFAWLVVIPAIVAFLGWTNPWVSVLAMIYSMWKAAVQALKLMGKWKKSARQEGKEREELQMRHHHDHCNKNPDGFRRLMIENIANDSRERVQRETEALGLDRSTISTSTVPQPQAEVSETRSAPMEEVFYRVLFLGKDDKWMVDNWNNGEFVGYHFACHPAWEGIWNESQSLDWRHYPLVWEGGGLYDWRARRAFLVAVRNRRERADTPQACLIGWNEDEIRKSCLLVGVSAYRCPGGASRYAALSDKDAIVASFRGLFIWPLPEIKDGGVQALVIEPIDMLPLDDFRRTHQLIAPPVKEPTTFKDEFVYEQEESGGMVDISKPKGG